MTTRNPSAESLGVLLVGNFFGSRRGNRQVCEDLADEFRLRGLRVVTTSVQSNPMVRLADMVLTAGAQRKAYDVAVVDVFSDRAFLWAEAVSRALRLAEKPIVLALHGGGLPAFAKSNGERVRRLLTSAARVVAPSPYLARELAPWADRVIEVLPNPIHLDRYALTIRRRAKPALVWVRAFHSIYNPELAVRVLALLTSEFPDASLTMTGADKGDGSLERARRTAESLGVRGRIRFTGPVPKARVPEMIEKGDIFLNTSRYDNTPTTVVEAMACGLGVVSTDVGGVPDLVLDGRNGLLAPADDPPAMARAVSRILGSNDLAERISRAARATAAEREMGRIAPRWIQLFEDVLRERTAAVGAAA